jgi:hypothetical protein
MMLLCTLAWFGLSPNLHVLGQNSAAVELTVSRTEMAVGQSVKVSLTFVNCKPTQLVPPEVDGLEFRMGPSTSTSTQWINGVTTSEQRFTYDYIARKEGEIKIPGLVWETTQGSLKTQPVRILVAPSNQKQAPANRPQGKSSAQVNQDLLTVIEPSKRHVYLGEPLVISYKIYNRYNGLDVREYDIPELEGFWKETIEDPEPRWVPELINGKRYNVATVRRIVAFPQQTGTFVMDGFSLKGSMRINFFEGREMNATCEPVTIQVMPLPEVAPPTSLGTFNRLSVQQSLSADSVGTHEAVTLEVTYRGAGNLKFLQEPTLAWPTEFEVFDSEVTDNISITDKGETGTRTFRFVAIPRSPGKYTLPALQATYFDPLTSTHVTSEAPSLALNVGKDGREGTPGVAYTHQQNVQMLNQDIRHIALTPSFFIPRGEVPWMKGIVMIIFSLGPLAFGLGVWRRSRRLAEARDRVGTRKKRAHRVLLATLAASEKSGTLDASVLGDALEQYLMAKLGWERSAMERNAVMAALQSKVPQLQPAWLDLWMASEMARYGGTRAEDSALAERLKNLAEQTENAWKG